MGQIAATRNLLATKVVRLAGQKYNQYEPFTSSKMVKKLTISWKVWKKIGFMYNVSYTNHKLIGKMDLEEQQQ